MAVLNAVSITEIKARGSIKDADVLKLRRNYYEDGIITAEEADVIFALNAACPVQDPAWADCFVETITDYLVEQAEPRGYLTAENGQWLIERIARDGWVDSKTELELLVNVLDKARWAPQSLVRFALEQVKQAVLSARGPLRSGMMLEPGIVGQADVDLLRRILYAAASDGCIAVTRAEAEVLFEINESSAGGDNHPAWTDLFVKAIANCAMAASGYAAPPREVALAGEVWLDRRGDLSLDAILSGVGPGLKGLFAGYRERTAEEGAIAHLMRQKVEIVTHDAVEPVNAAWLTERIGRDGGMTPNEHAPLMFLKAEGPVMDPALRVLVDKAVPVV
ncbi:MAG TPA: hypothetical protein VH519_08950 [Hyphomicrobiaceae bacterium]